MAVTRRPVSQRPVCSFRKGKGPALSNGFLSIPRLSESLLSSPHPPASSLTGLAFFLLPGIRTPTSSGNGAGPGLPFNLLNAEKCDRGNVAEDKMPHWVHGSTAPELRPFIHLSPPLLRKTTPRASRSVATNLAGNLNCLLKNLLPYISSSPWAGLSLSLLQP